MWNSFKLASFFAFSLSSVDLGSLEEIIISERCMKMVQNCEFYSRDWSTLTRLRFAEFEAYPHCEDVLPIHARIHHSQYESTLSFTL